MNSHFVIGIVITIAAFGSVAVISRRFSNPKIRGPALAGTARVLSVENTTGPTGGSQNLVSLRIGLTVEVPGRQPYDVTVKRKVELIHLARVQPGATLPVEVDATNPQTVRIDFAQPISAQD
jgi:hypothetical protein